MQKKEKIKLIIVYDLTEITLMRLEAALLKNKSETDTELTGNPLELSIRTYDSDVHKGQPNQLGNVKN